MLPVVELRGAIPLAFALGIPWPLAAAAAVSGNMLPAPFIILFVRRVFSRLKEFAGFAGLINRLERRAMNKAAALMKKGKLYRCELVVLCLIVAVPLPGTGAWTGALIAALLNLRLKYSLVSVFAGVLIAAAIVTGGTYGLFGRVFRLF